MLRKVSHPPSPETTGMPVEEGENGEKNLASADVRPYLEKADEPGETPKRKFWNEGGAFIFVIVHGHKTSQWHIRI